MTLNASTAVQVRVGNEEMIGFFSGFDENVPVRDGDIPLVESMTVILKGPPGVFKIEGGKPETQLVGKASGSGANFQQHEFGRWDFDVTPLKVGRHKLGVVVSGEVTGASGKAQTTLAPRTFDVEVVVGASTILHHVARAGWGLIALLFASFVGAITQDLWWPPLRAAMEQAGIIEPRQEPPAESH
ncbi:MAG: hypothetical protein AB7L26_16830 [Hyphomonadaceae bacterium]